MDAAPPDIFVSYSAADRERIRPLVQSLEQAGFNVWWDTRIAPGAGFDAEIQAAIDAARCVVVFWTENSVSSEWVITEADEGLERGVLVPVSIDGVRPPLAFRRRQTLDVADPKTGGSDVVAAVRTQLEGGPAYVESRHRPVSSRRSPWAIVASVAVGLTIGAAVMFWLSRSILQAPGPSAPSTAVRITLELDDWVVEDLAGFGTSLTISRTGEKIAYIARSASGNILKLRHLDRLTSIALSGTEGAESPFFSPDGMQVGYFHAGVIKRISIDGGDPSIVATLERPMPLGASWGDDGRIIFAEDASALKTVSVRSSGVVEPLTELDASRQEYSHRLPHHVPGHDVLLYSRLAAQVHEIWALNLATGETRYLLDGITPRYVETGHMLYAKGETATQGTLWAVPFDPQTMSLIGEAQAIQGAIAGREGAAYFAGHMGPLVYLPTQGEPVSELILIDPDGSSRVIAKGVGFTDPKFSNSGRSVAVAAVDVPFSKQSLWIHEIETGASRRFIDNGWFPVWASDDQSIVFVQPNVGLVAQAIDRGRVETLVATPAFIAPHQWIGQTLVFTLAPPGVTEDKRGVYTLAPGQGQRHLLNYRRSAFPSVSRDGQWVAFCTWPRGVVVGRYPNFGAATVVSETGCFPQWAPDQKRLYYQEANALWSVEASTGESAAFAKREFIAELGLQSYMRYDVDAAGRIVIARYTHADPKPLVLLVNWANQFQ